ncbi:potassium transporter [Salinisphaera orenii MK-B5]|uniref:Trimethylamine monooxygenase n=1 Tax=Salinisphaera orenii MK-B5 TaxID=856730 RepID=A0A423PF65_9GAMM|nr:NAD(P)/FAD-dependent oxidoreductase [Salinisphaera orenii]ROO24205.1 potassium transporter [Salinisphaera orenii MK-B5]
MTQRVAIIGAGPCGLAQLNAFEQAREAGADVPELVCFEKQDDWGGLWNYSWRTGLDEHGEPVHGSMYRYLWSNGPKEALEFADYPFEEHFGGPIPSFPPREVLADYIFGRAEKRDVRRHIRFSTAVRWVERSADGKGFSITVEDLTTREKTTETFDHVIVAIGHFSVPNVPEFPGFDRFPGRILHSHDFRDAVEFENQRLLVVGSSYSAEDIALQCRKYGSGPVTISYRTAAMGFDWPEGMEEVPLLKGMDGKTAHFVDGSTREIDAIVLCTGYQHQFPFMADTLKLRTANRLYPADLYKGVFWLEDPDLMYLGMQDQYYTFTMFDTEAWVARDYVLGRLALPDRSERATDIALWQQREERLDGAFDDIDFQADHIADLASMTDYPAFDIDLTRDIFKAWEHHKDANILTYRDRAGFTSPCTGTASPAHHTDWWVALDDSMATYVGERAPASRTG